MTLHDTIAQHNLRISQVCENMLSGHHCAHVLAWLEHKRALLLERRRIRELAAREWNAMPDYERGFVAARRHIAMIPPARLMALQTEWEMVNDPY